MIPPGALIGGATARKRVIGGVALIVAAALTVAGAVLIGDFATTTYAGYEVGLQRGAIIVVVLLAVIGPAAGVLVLRAARRDPSGQ